MDGNKTLLIVVLIGITIWNIPETTSIFYGQHTFYNGSAICQKCHQDIQNILDLNSSISDHNQFNCRDCHSRDGNTSHVAKISYCSDCHIIHTNNDCNLCHISHGGLKILPTPTPTPSPTPITTPCNPDNNKEKDKCKK
jgi:hypothetical protein